ncbi:MAG: hypothetical protein AB7F50_01160 [Fimbriimonadaceae bacterium]
MVQEARPVTPRWAYPLAALAVWASAGCFLFLRGQAWGFWAVHAATAAGFAWAWLGGEKVWPQRAALLVLFGLRFGDCLRKSLPFPAEETSIFLLSSLAVALVFLAMNFGELTAARWLARRVAPALRG